MRLMIILKVTKKQGFTLSLEDAFLEKPQGVFRVEEFKRKIKLKAHFALQKNPDINQLNYEKI